MDTVPFQKFIENASAADVAAIITALKLDQVGTKIISINARAGSVGDTARLEIVFKRPDGIA